MQGVAIQSTKNKFQVSFDRKYYNEKSISNLLELFDLNMLAEKINFDDDLLDVSKEIKSNIWKKEKERLGI